MLNVAINNRPFASELITGLMLPDGLFEASLGRQRINVHVSNSGPAAINNAEVYVESVSHPSIVVTPTTYPAPHLVSGVSYLFGWDIDLTGAPPGKHLVSFIVKTAADIRRIIKRIFVSRITFNAAAGTFRAECPEGVIEVEFKDMVRPKRGGGCCCKTRSKSAPRRDRSGGKPVNILEYLTKGFQGHDPDFEFCLPEYLPRVISAQVTPTPPYAGQYGDLPFQDPWWKVLLCILALLLLIAAAIAEAVDGSGELSTTGGPGGAGSPTGDCCGLEPSGGGTSYIAAGLVAAAAAVATAAAASDVRDPFRKGADHTPPAVGELTVGEHLDFEYIYTEPVALGRPFQVDAKWKYVRTTTGGTYSHTASETNANVHVLSRYEIKAPDVVRAYKREPFVIRGMFFDADEKLLRGADLFVQCFLVGPEGQWRKLMMEDHGAAPDEKANDGSYTGRTYFGQDDVGLWKYFVIAQDINDARPDMEPEEAAQIIGGMVLTHQLTLTFDGGTCSLVPDGDVNVIA